MSAKTELRNRLRTRRAAEPGERRARVDDLICERLATHEAYARAAVVFSYLSFGTETSTRAILDRAWHDGKTVALPWCVPGTRTMRWFEVDGLNGLVRSRMGVEEPDPHTFAELPPSTVPADEALAIVPGLAFDLSRHRLGYGGGFYDTFLRDFCGTSIGLCHDWQLVPDLGSYEALEAHDLPVDVVITELRLV